MTGPIESYIWYEKYRPIDLDKMVMDQTTRATLQKFIVDRTIPHLLFYGPAGSGKTTTAQILVDNLPCTVMMLNASSGDRGVEVMKTKVKQFAAAATMPDKPIKIVFFDEADGLTLDAQKALRNTIETYQAHCRFIFTANHVDKIHDAIRSRCMCFEFNQFPMAEMKKFAMSVMRQEGIKFERGEVSKVVERFYPDFRTILNTLHLGSLSGTFNSASVAALNIDMTSLFGLLLDGRITELRQMVAGITDFAFIYKAMFDDLITFMADTAEGPFGGNGTVYAMDSLLVLAEHVAMDSTIPDRELCFAACCVGIMKACNIEAVF